MAENNAAWEKFEAAYKADFEKFKLDIEARMDMLEHRLLIRLGVMMVALFGAFAFLV